MRSYRTPLISVDNTVLFYPPGVPKEQSTLIGSSTYNLTAVSQSDIFIAKFDGSGNSGWAKRMGAANGETADCITNDVSGNIYSTGTFGGLVDFDPGPGVYNLMGTDGQVFISKLDAGGNFIWAKQIGGTGEGKSIFVDINGNIYATGLFSLTGDFDPGPAYYNLTSNGWADIFISKLDVNGNFVWAKSMEGFIVILDTMLL